MPEMTKQQQRQAAAFYAAQMRLVEAGLPAAFVFSNSDEFINAKPDPYKQANMLKDQAQTRSTNQQYLQNLEEQPIETEKKRSEMFYSLAKDRIENPEIVRDAQHLARASAAMPNISPSASASLYDLGQAYVSKNEPFWRGQTGEDIRYLPEERAQMGAALEDTAAALGIPAKAVLNNTSGNWVHPDANKYENLLQGIATTSAEQQVGREKATGSTWLNRLQFMPGSEGFADEDVIRAYTNAKGGQLNVVNAARTMRMASSPEMISEVEKQTGMKWDEYRDWMNKAPNSKVLWTQYLMAVDERANSPKK